MILNDTDKLVIFFSFGLIIYIYSRRRRSSFPLPPGPKKLPLLGNLFDIPTKNEWLKYLEWGKQFNSNIIHINAVGQDLIILNSFDAAVELFDRRSSIYSSRPQFTMINDLMGWGWMMASMVEFIRKMLPRLLDAPGEFLRISSYTIGGMALSLSYGIEIKQTEDPFIDLAEKTLRTVSMAANLGAFLVNVIPILKYVPEFVPGAGFQKQARIWRRLQEYFRERPYSASKEAMASGQAPPSFVSVALADVDESRDINHQEEIIKDTAGIIFAAGVDPAAVAIHTFFLAMICFPEVQIKAQAELDRVVSGRLPDFSDMNDLPYLSALVMEVNRWQPVTPYGVPHSTTEDDVYEGYQIPKGSIVIPNAWAMLYDEVQYPDPSAFKPERRTT